MFEEAVFFLALAGIGAVALGCVTAIHLRRQRLVAFAVRERERTLAGVIEKFGDLPELATFAQSAEAQALFATLDAPAMLARRLIQMIALAVVLIAIGLGQFATVTIQPPSNDINFVMNAVNAKWWGIMLNATGIGLIVAAAICARLARRWGVIGT